MPHDFFRTGANSLNLRNMLAAALCALLLLGAVTTNAQDTTAEETVTGSEVVVTAGRINESLDDPPVFIQIIDMDDFQGRLVTVPDALRQATGVTVKSLGGLGRDATISIRGSSADQVVVMVDGVRLNSATGGGFDLSSIPADQIDRIEVVRGGDSAFFGEGAVGGVVNIVTKKGKGPARNTVGLSYGSFNTFDTTAARSQGFEKGGYLVSANLFHTDGNFPFESDNGTALDESDDRVRMRQNNAATVRNLLVKGDAALSDRLALAVQNDLHSAVKGMPGIVTFPARQAWQQELRNVTQVSATLADSPARGLSFKTALSHRYNHLAFSDRLGEQTGVPVQAAYTEYEPAVAETVQYIWGMHQILALQGNWQMTALREKDPVYGDPERTAWGAALRDQVVLWSERITLVPALRYDALSDAPSQWSPKFGLALRPLPWLAIKGNAGRSFRAPNFSELYFNQGFVEGNPDLKPERAISLDAGIQLTTRPFFGEVAYFRSDVEDLIEYMLVSGFRYKPFNVGRALLHGMEASASFAPWQYATLTGSYTLTYAIDTTEGANRKDMQIPGRPRRQAYGRLEAGPALVKTFVEYNYVGPNFITRANTKLLDERHILNAGCVVHPSPDVAIGFEMKNVLDDPAVDLRGFPLPKRAVYASLEVGF